jgi:MFS family permease
MFGISTNKIIMGRLADKFGIEKAISFGIANGCIGCTFMLLNGGKGFMVLIGAFLLGMSAALSTLTPPLVTRSIFGLRDYSKIYSYISTVGSLVNAFIISAFGFVYDITGSYSFNFIFIGISLLLAGITVFGAFKSANKHIFSQVRANGELT